MKRRTLLAGGVAVAAGGAALGHFTGLFGGYAPTPYDDLLGPLKARPAAILLGRQMADTADAATLADALRGRGAQNGLQAAAQADIAAGRMAEVAGWIVPRSVAQMAALAAKA